MSHVHLAYQHSLFDDSFPFFLTATPPFPVGAIVGIVVGVVVLASCVIILLAVLICCCLGCGIFATLGCACASTKKDKADLELKSVGIYL